MLRIAYLTTCSPQDPTSGHALRVHANWRAMQAVGETRVWAFDSRPPPHQRRLLRHDGVTVLGARAEGRLPRVLRHLRALANDRSMLYAKAMSPRQIAQLGRELRAWQADLLVIGDTWLADLIEPLRGSARRVAVDTHNVESHLYRQLVADSCLPATLKFRLFLRNVRRLERRLGKADAVFAVSAVDAAIYRQEQRLDHLHVLPNALDLQCYQPRVIEVEPAHLVFTGSYAYWPNEAAALHLIGMSRELDTKGIMHRLCLVGRGPTQAMLAAAKAAPHVAITGPVQEIQPYIAQAALVVAPLTSGSGTKFKILEAMALGRPVITTPTGAEGLDLVDGVHAAIAPDLGEFGERVASYIANPARAERMGAAGRDFVIENHSLTALEHHLRTAMREMGLL